MKYNHHQPSLAKKIFFSSSFKSELKSLMATDEHFLFLVTLPFLSNLQMPSHSPRVSPCSTSQTGTLFCWASPLMILTQLASVQFLAKSTYLALTFSSLLSKALDTSWMPLASNESAFEVWMILLRAVSKSTAWIYVVIQITKYYLINQYSFPSQLLNLSEEVFPYFLLSLYNFLTLLPSFLIILSDYSTKKSQMQSLTIFFIWLGSTLPEHYNEKFQECLRNYDGNCKLIGEKEQAELVRKYNVYHANNTVIQRADVLRLLVMQQYGGIYLDFDVQINDWNYLRILRCENYTFFCQEQIALIYQRLYKVGNWMICSGKNTSELRRLIQGLKPMHANPSIKEILDYAGPGYLVNQKAPYMIVYPNIKHCYQNNWTNKREGCVTPFYSIIDYFGTQCWILIGVSWVLIFSALYFFRNHIFRWFKVGPQSLPIHSEKDYESEHL